MLMRHWATAAMIAGFALCLPGVVMASGKQGANPQDHGLAVQHVNVQHAEKAVNKVVQPTKKSVAKETGQPLAHAKQQVTHAVHSVDHKSQAALHASQQAVEHASAKSAVHLSATVSVRDDSGTSSIHMDSKQVHTGQVKVPVHVNRKANLDAVKSHLSKKQKTVTKSKAKPKKQMKTNKKSVDFQGENQSKLVSKQQPKKRPQVPLSEQPSAPLAVLMPASAGMGPMSHTRPVKGQGSSGAQGANFWILPHDYAGGKLLHGTFVSRVSQYRSQWINAPPSPPPETTSPF